MKGPCLCGDPYCPHCGNPDLARQEEVAELIYEAVMKVDPMPTDEQLGLFISRLPELLREVCLRDKFEMESG